MVSVGCAICGVRIFLHSTESALWGQLVANKLDLDFLGVHPDHHRRGIGKLMLNWGLGECAKQARDCYLVATPAGVPLYAASGFENLAVVDLFGVGHYSMIKRHS